MVAWIVDLILLGIVSIVIGALLGAVGLGPTATAPIGPPGTPQYWNGFTRADPIGTVLTVAVSALYFIGFWSGGRRGTPGQRMLSIQVGNAFDGRPLTMDQAIRRWLGLGDVITLLGVLPAAAGLGSLARLDFLSDGEELFVNEVNNIPGAMSLYLWPDDDPARLLLGAVEQAVAGFGREDRGTAFARGEALRAAGGIASKLAGLGRTSL